MTIDLTQMQSKQSGTIHKMYGGHGFMGRLQGMGIKDMIKATVIMLFVAV